RRVADGHAGDQQPAAAAPGRGDLLAEDRSPVPEDRLLFAAALLEALLSQELGAGSSRGLAGILEAQQARIRAVDRREASLAVLEEDEVGAAVHERDEQL